MIIKYEFVGDRAVIHIPENVCWEIFTRSVNDAGYDDYGLYLVVDGKERTLSETDCWCSGRELPNYAVGDLHNEVVEVVTKRIAEDPNLRVLDIEGIISELLCTEYVKKWQEKGYITLDADGSW